jgi:hypothetical protein
MVSMDGTALNRILLTMAMFVTGNIANAQSCVNFPEGSTNPVVSVCETESDYIFHIGDAVRSFPRGLFESRLTHAARKWFESQKMTTELLAGASARIWMTVPEVNPEAAQPRLIVTTPAGSISFWFDLWSDEWVFADKETAVLGRKTYPESFGYRPKMVLVQSTDGASEDQVKAALLSCGAERIESRGGGWFTAFARTFEETSLAANARKSHSSTIKMAQVNSVMEWIADRKMVLSFKIVADELKLEFGDIEQ